MLNLDVARQEIIFIRYSYSKEDLIQGIERCMVIIITNMGNGLLGLNTLGSVLLKKYTLDNSYFHLASIWIVACSDETCPTNFCHPERQICGCNDNSDCNFDGSFVKDDICVRPRNSTAPGVCAGNRFS